MSRLNSLENDLGISFKSKALLRLALVHRSFMNEKPAAAPESNERLEFLGDALVGLVVAHDLYERYPERTEGELTAVRSALVQGETLARIAESLRLGQYLSMGKGEQASGGRERPSNLATVFEALVGAIFLDQGYEAARAFVLAALTAEQSVVGLGKVPKSPKSLLQEVVQRDGAATPSYRVVEATGEDHAPCFTAEVAVAGEVLGKGKGRRKSHAETAAAREALRVLGHGP